MGIQFSSLSSAALTIAALTCLPAVTSAQPNRPAVLVMLQNEANAPSDLVERAKSEVARLFRLIEVEIAWATDVPEPGTRLRVVSITTWEPSDQSVQPSVLGYTQIAPGKRGIRGYVFWRRVERASHTFTASLDNVLAVAIAHEIGHMLLPNGRHAKRGLMGAPWDASHFRSASAGLLTFSPDSAASIRRELEEDRSTAAASSSVR